MTAMKVTIAIIPLLTFFMIIHKNKVHVDTHNVKAMAPTIKLIGPDEAKQYTWKEQVQYSIAISDPNDGESKYGEIPPQECLLVIAFVPGDDTKGINIAMAKPTEKGLNLMKKTTCFGCHAQETRIAGPSFQEIAQRYKTGGNAIQILSGHILKGSVGVWGNQQMPAHPELTGDEAREIAAYILQVSRHPYRWIYPGLEGMFTILEKPENAVSGAYVLTASYVSTSGEEGKISKVLKIR